MGFGDFASGFSEGVAPYAQSIIQQRKAEDRKSKRLETIRTALQSFYPDATEQQINDFASLNQEGVAQSPTVLQKPERPDLTDYFATVKAPEWVMQLYKSKVIDPEKAVELGLKTGERPQLGDEFFNGLVKSRVFGPDVTVDMLKGLYGFSQAFGRFPTEGMMAGGAAGKQANEPEWLAKTKWAHDKIGDKTYTEVMADKALLAELDAGGTTVLDIQRMFGYDPDLVVKAESSLLNQIKASSFELQLDMAGYIGKWQADQSINSNTKKILDENFDKGTGQLKPEVIAKQVQRLDEIATDRTRTPQQKAKKLLIEKYGDEQWNSISKEDQDLFIQQQIETLGL